MVVKVTYLDEDADVELNDDDGEDANVVGADDEGNVKVLWMKPIDDTN